MTSSGFKRENRAKTADIIVGVVLLLAVVCWLVSSGNYGRTQSAAGAGMNGLQEQKMQYAPATGGGSQK
jgi:uncharacterized ion transporter superfamily protein YfcC